MCATRERVTNARSASDSGEYRDPKMRTVCARGAGAQVLAAGRGGLEDHRGQVAPLTHEAAEGVGPDVEHPARLPHPGGEVGPLPGEQADSADELAGSERADGLLALDVGSHDLDLAVEHHVEALGPTAGPQQLLPLGHLALDAVRGELGDRLRVPRGEGVGR